MPGRKWNSGFFLDRVDVERARVAIGQCVQRAVHVHLVAAMAAVAGRENAVVRADLALDVAAEFEVMVAFFDPAPLVAIVPKARLLGASPLKMSAGASDSRHLAKKSKRKPRPPGRPHPRRQAMAARREIPPPTDSGSAPAAFGAAGGLRTAACRHFTARSRCLIQPHRWNARYIAGTTCASTRTIKRQMEHTVERQRGFLVQQFAEAVAAIHDVTGQEKGQHQRQQEPTAPAHDFERDEVEFAHIPFEGKAIAPPSEIQRRRQQANAGDANQRNQERAGQRRAQECADEIRRVKAGRGRAAPSNSRRLASGNCIPTSMARIKVSSAMAALMNSEDAAVSPKRFSSGNKNASRMA